MIKEYHDLGTDYSPQYLTTIFLQKIEGINDVKSPFFGFYTTITTLPDQQQTLEYIKRKFQETAAYKVNHGKPDTSEKKPGKRNHSEVETSGKRNNNQAEPSNHKAIPLQSKYTPQQLESLKKMTPEEKKKIQCKKCGEYFHLTDVCKNPGKMCFRCFQYGHISKECKYPKKGNFLSTLNINSFNYDECFIVFFIVDSAANQHMVKDKSILFDYKEFDFPVAVETADKNNKMHAIGEGSLPILVTFGKTQTIIILHNVQCVPNIDNLILSVSALSRQFKAALILYPRTGYLSCRSLNRKLASIEQVHGIYRLRAQLLAKENINEDHELESSNVIPKRVSSNCFIYENQSGLPDSTRVTCLKTIARNQKRKIKRKLTPQQLRLLKQEGDLWHRRMGTFPLLQ